MISSLPELPANPSPPAAPGAVPMSGGGEGVRLDFAGLLDAAKPAAVALGAPTPAADMRGSAAAADAAPADPGPNPSLATSSALPESLLAADPRLPTGKTLPLAGAALPPARLAAAGAADPVPAEPPAGFPAVAVAERDAPPLAARPYRGALSELATSTQAGEPQPGSDASPIPPAAPSLAGILAAPPLAGVAHGAGVEVDLPAALPADGGADAARPQRPGGHSGAPGALAAFPPDALQPDPVPELVLASDTTANAPEGDLPGEAERPAIADEPPALPGLAMVLAVPAVAVPVAAGADTGAEGAAQSLAAAAAARPGALPRSLADLSAQRATAAAGQEPQMPLAAVALPQGAVTAGSLRPGPTAPAGVAGTLPTMPASSVLAASDPAQELAAAAPPAPQPPAGPQARAGEPSIMAAAEPVSGDPGRLAPLASAAAEAGAADALAPAPGSAASTPPAQSPALPPVLAALEAATAPNPASPADRAEPRAQGASPQQQSTIDQVGDLREALRSARPAMTLNHAEFGAISVRLEAGGTEGWRAVLASRDPGFVPAIQQALAERAVAAAGASSDGGGFTGQQGASHNAAGDHRSGSSLSGGQGGSQAYLGHSGSRDGEAAPDHRRPSTAAALAARAEAEEGGSAAARGPQSGGLFA